MLGLPVAQSRPIVGRRPKSSGASYGAPRQVLHVLAATPSPRARPGPMDVCQGPVTRIINGRSGLGRGSAISNRYDPAAP